MNKRIILIPVIILLVIIIGALFYFKDNIFNNKQPQLKISDFKVENRIGAVYIFQTS